MRKPKSYSINEVFNSALIGFVFEFFCSKESSFIVEDLEKILGKNVSITSEYNMKPTYTSSILLKEYDGLRPRYQFKVGYQRYNEVLTFLNTMLFWINENASLDNTTMLRVKVNYDFKELNTLMSISNMDVGKLILRMDEGYALKRFPEMNSNPNALSIKKLVPFNMAISASNVVNLRHEFIFPNAPYYAIDITEQTKGELTYNYIGGSKYSEKPKEVKELLDYYVINTFQALNSDEYLPSDVQELNRLTEEYRKFRKCYYDPKKFLKVYKDFVIFVDLINNQEVIESQWFQLRDSVAKLILESGVSKCKFNWDTNLGTFQIKDANIESSVINGFQIIGSKIKGVMENCSIWDSEITGSRIINSTLVSDNKVVSCYMEKTRVDKFNRIEESYINNNGEIINCKVFRSVIKNAGIGNNAKMDEQCVIISHKDPRPIPSKNAMEVKEIRDYKWIKSLRSPDYRDRGFANEYKD